jgi:hypothetical protein
LPDEFLAELLSGGCLEPGAVLNQSNNGSNDTTPTTLTALLKTGSWVTIGIDKSRLANTLMGSGAGWTRQVPLVRHHLGSGHRP